MESAPATQTKESTHLTPSDAAYYLIKPTLSPDFPRTDYKQGGCLAFAYGGAPFGPEQTYLECTWAGRAASWAWRERIEKEAERAGRPASEVKVAVEDTCFALAVFDKVWEM